jgi:hypothetical protein
MTKQGNFALMGLLLAAVAWESWRRGEGLPEPLGRLAALALPAVLVTLGWRLGIEAGVGELSVKPPAAWEWDLLPEMLTSMASVVASKGGYFGLGAVLAAAALLTLRSERSEWQAVRTFAALFLGYNAFLVFVYLAILGGSETATAASFWRYNTHLGMLELFAAAALAGMAWRRVAPRAGVRSALVALGCVAVIAGPFLSIKFLRFDRQPVKVHVRQVIAEMAPLLPPGGKLTIVDPRGSGFYANYVDYHLGFGRQVSFAISAYTGAAELARIMERARADHLWVHTQTPASAAIIGLDLAPAASHLLAPEGSGWRLVRSWPFPGYTDPTAVKD